MGRNYQTTKVYLVGGGIASLASAVFLIRDAHFPAANIHILEELNVLGGSLDAHGSPETGYSMRGGRMFNFSYRCTYDLLSSIPSLGDPNKTVKDEMDEFNAKFRTESKARVVENGAKVDVSSMGFSYKDRFDLIGLTLHDEEHYGNKRINEYFEPEFFKTNFWYMWATMFAFEPWHSLVEFKRYVHRFIHEFHRINTLAGVDRTPYNQYEAIVLPIIEWLRGQGVCFDLNCRVTNLNFELTGDEKTVERIYLNRNGESKEIAVAGEDFVFVTLGCMTEGSSLGSMTSAPVLNSKKDGGAWTLWENIAAQHPDFGRPEVFIDNIDDSKWESFTVTCKDPTFFRLMEEFTGNKAGTGGLVTFKNSNWLMSIVLAHQPHFLNQPENVQVFWGYALYVDETGNHIKKKMPDCTGAEILTEILYHLKFEKEKNLILETSICIPCMMPFITSFFMPRKKGDRPPVIPEDATNFAFLGQYCEIPDDVVFTVEYSVRAAQMAVYQMFNVDKEPPAMYKGQYDPRVLFNAVKTMLK
jgi:oleate hydratase